MFIFKYNWYSKYRKLPHLFHSSAELSTNFLGNLVVLWNYDIQTLQHKWYFEVKMTYYKMQYKHRHLEYKKYLFKTKIIYYEI